MKYLNRVTSLAVLFFGFSFGVQAQPEITRYTIDGGGGTSQGGSTSISGTIGQPDAGVLSGGDLQIRGGFWIGAGGAGPATETPTATGIAPTFTPTPTPPASTATPTQSQPAPSPTHTSPAFSLDVKPDPLDEYIDALDLIEWVSRMKAPQPSPDVLFEFSIYWKGVYPPAVKSQDPSE